MDKVLEAGAVEGVTALNTPASPSHTHAECLNCGTQLHGKYCQSCGQSSDDHHRSIGHLLWEAVESFTHLDGRLAQTLPALLFHPGRLARDHIEGRRQRHVPPFRLFLISLLIFMFAAEWAVNHHHEAKSQRQVATASQVRRVYQVGHSKVVVVKGLSNVKDALKAEGAQGTLVDWLQTHVGRAVNNREYFLTLVFEWAHRLAVLLLPILAGLTTLLYAYRRQFYIYDHLVVSMQYLSFCFLIWAVVWAAPAGLAGVLGLVAFVWTPINLYLILRGAYGSSRVGAAIKALALWLTTAAGFGVLLVGLLAYALYAV